MSGAPKTVDGGRSWARVLYVDERTGCADLALDPGNPQKLFAALLSVLLRKHLIADWEFVEEFKKI